MDTRTHISSHVKEKGKKGKTRKKERQKQNKGYAFLHLSPKNEEIFQ